MKSKLELIGLTTKPFGLFRKRQFNPTRFVVFSFGAIILTGTVLLMLPWASTSGESAGLMTALFTSTSATCVTGLALVDTATSWTIFGQGVILLMIQMGGLGFMTVLTLFSLALNRRINLSERLLIVSTLNLTDTDGVVRVVRNALRLTFAVEGAGALILAFRFVPEYGLAGGIWRGVFTSVSAMCNAGFDLFGPEAGGSLMRYQKDPVVLLVIMFLIVFGGLGFFVWEDIRRAGRWRNLRLYSRMVLVMTGALIVLGAVYFMAVEWNNPNTMGELAPGWKVLNSFFQSVTLRTAGFYSIPQGTMHDSSMVMSSVLMLIGGSSGSTAGGLKTVTVAVLLLTLRAGLRGNSEVTVRRRTIDQERIINAMTLFMVVVILFFAGSMAISLLDEVHYLEAAFETASALGTVGLTTGITPILSGASHVLLIALMFLGRVGVLSFSIAFLTVGGGKNNIHYPTYNVMIG